MRVPKPLEGLVAAGAEAAMIEGVLPAVVQVQRRGGRRRGLRGGTGAGFLWSPDGSVMTNHHVVVGSGGKAEVILTDDRSFGAEVVGSSHRLDLAMLRLREAPAEDLSIPPVGDSDGLRVGELVFAVGHPWGRRGAVTAGIVNSLDTVGRPPFGRSRYVQSDVYLAPGNSGGPLVNARGEVVGVNAMISSGLALAIPSNTVGAWASGSSRTTRRPRLGVTVQSVTLPPSQIPMGQRAGLVIAGLSPNSPADRAGLLIGDVLLAVANEPVKDAASLREALARAGEIVRLRVMRGGEMREVEVELGDSGQPRARGA